MITKNITDKHDHKANVKCNQIVVYSENSLRQKDFHIKTLW